MSAGITYTKRFDNKQLTMLEVNGYDFIKQYYAKIPRLLRADETAVTYSSVLDANMMFVTSALQAGQSVDLEEFFKVWSRIALEHQKTGQSSGGTRLFYLNRLSRLDQCLSDLYAVWLGDKDFILNDQKFVKSKTMFEDISTAVKSFTAGLIVPSQGDVHERNITLDGRMIDFEGAGFNLLATDAATFLWHTLFAGNYFGPRYAKWATNEDRDIVSQLPSVFVATHQSIDFSLMDNRKNLISQYLKHYLSVFDVRGSLEADIQAAIAYRLLTTFVLKDMSHADRNISFCLASFFLDKTMSLADKYKLLGL